MKSSKSFSFGVTRERWNHALKSEWQFSPVLTMISLLVVVLHHGGWLQPLEGKGLSLIQKMMTEKVEDVFIVGITDEDFKSKELFGGRRTLDSEKVKQIVNAILIVEPKVLVVDIDLLLQKSLFVAEFRNSYSRSRDSLLPRASSQVWKIGESS